VDGLTTRIQELMDLRGWTAYEFAHRAGLGDSLISNWLRRGVKRPDPEALRKLAAIAGVREAWLRDGVGPRELPAFNEHLAPASMQAREHFEGSLIVARGKRPQYDDYLWETIADGDPLMVAPMTPGLLIALADALVDHIPAPTPTSTKQRT
jgi:transcriptional regulator with XRE-family HTH domain